MADELRRLGGRWLGGVEEDGWEHNFNGPSFCLLLLPNKSACSYVHMYAYMYLCQDFLGRPHQESGFFLDF